MNKRARQRLIGVTALVLVIMGAIVVGTTTSDSGSGAVGSSVDEVLADPTLVGEKVKVNGLVVDGSWEQGTRPMRFDIRPEEEGAEGILAVVYDGTVPTSFGDGSPVIITGTYTGDAIESSEMIVKCPSKYESGLSALTVDEALEKAEDIRTAQIRGFVAAIGSDGFTLRAEPDGGTELELLLETALPENVTAGTEIVVEVSFEDDVWTATDVAELAGE